MDDTTKSLIFIVFLISIIAISAYTAIKAAPSESDLGTHPLSDVDHAKADISEEKISDVDNVEREYMAKG